MKITVCESLDPARNELVTLVGALGTQKAAAQRLGFSSNYINDVMRGRKGISDTLAARLGFRVVRCFVRTSRRGLGGVR